VIVDLARLERNIAEMAALAYEAQVTLRPHIKTHKTLQIAAMQLDAGAVGLTCAKVGEAEVLADSGFTNLFVCYPIVTEMKARRLAALAARPGLSVSSIADSYQGIAALSAAFVGADEPLETLVKVNTGLGRVGVAPGRLLWTSRDRSQLRQGYASTASVHTRGSRTACQTPMSAPRPRALGLRHWWRLRRRCRRPVCAPRASASERPPASIPWQGCRA